MPNNNSPYTLGSYIALLIFSVFCIGLSTFLWYTILIGGEVHPAMKLAWLASIVPIGIVLVSVSFVGITDYLYNRKHSR